MLDPTVTLLKLKSGIFRDWTANREISTSVCDDGKFYNKYTNGESFSAFMLPSFCPIVGAFCLVGYVLFCGFQFNYISLL